MTTRRKVIKNIENFWQEISVFYKILIVLLVLFVVPVVINFVIYFGNFLFQMTGWNINATGLENPDWFAFWGAYLSGIATVVAVWLTVRQAQDHYLETSKEQKRQNKKIEEDQEKQRRLDVLPLIVLQPRAVAELSGIVKEFADLIEEKKAELVRIDELTRGYEEYDVSEVTIILAENLEFRLGGPTDDEFIRVKNGGRVKVPLNGGTYTYSRASYSFLRPNWLINAGKEAAINITIWLKVKNNKEYSIGHPFLLMPKEKIKLNVLVDVKLID